MALWQKVQKLNSNEVKEIVKLYSSKNIPIELRDFCAVWIEGSLQQSSPEKFCTGLRRQLQEKLQSLTTSSSSNNLTLPFYVIEKLAIFQSTLSTGNAAILQDIYNRFQECMELEKFFINKDNNLGNTQPTLNTVRQSQNSVPISNPNNVATAKNVNFSSSQNKEVLTTAVASSSLLAQSSQVQNEKKESVEFLNNPIKIAIDGEMDNIAGAVWVLEESSNNFSIKCHETKLLQELRDQHQLNLADNATQPQTFQIRSQFQEIQSNINQIRSEIKQTAIQIHGKIIEVGHRSSVVIQNWNKLKTELDMDLSSWAIQQKLNANGKPITLSQSRLQSISEYLIDVAWKLRSFLITTDKVRLIHQSVMEHFAPKYSSSSDISEKLFTVTSLIKQLVQSTFVVVHQPCQVLKTSKRFPVLPGKKPMEICLFVGEKLGLQLSPPTVNVCIVDEYTYKNIQNKGLDGANFGKVIKIGRLLPDTTRLDFCSAKKCSSAVFGQISLKDFFRNAKKVSQGREQTELVTEEKYALLFRSEFHVGGIEFKVWRLSLPIVITTHGSQDSLAWAAVTWDNTFSLANRIPFQLPDYVNFEGVRDMLNDRFTALVGAPLTQENISYFAERLSMCSAGFPTMLTWSEMCKNCLPGRKFSLWDWFYEGAKFIEQYLKDAWKEGHVRGFIGKELSENMLRSCLPGTFLLRFSESTLGGISIVWLHSDGTPYSLAPFKSKDLASQSFVEKLNQETLHYVYPNIKKKDAFKKYYAEHESATRLDKSAEVGSDRYVKFRNQVVLDNPGIPRFNFPEASSLEEHKINTYEYEVTTAPQQQDQSEHPISTTDENETYLTEIDIDRLLNIHCAQDSSSDASLNSPWHQSSIDGEINNSNLAGEITMYPEADYEETFCLRL